MIKISGKLESKEDGFSQQALFHFVTAEALERSEELLTNKAVNAIIRKGKPFIPMEGNTRNDAYGVFVLSEEACSHVAVFNFTRAKAETLEVNLVCAGSSNFSAGICLDLEDWTCTN